MKKIPQLVKDLMKLAAICGLLLGMLIPVLASAQVSTNFWKLSSGILSPILTTFTLQVSNQSSDPAGSNGAIYYNTGSNVFRCYQNSTWTNCIGSGGGGSSGVGTWSTTTSQVAGHLINSPNNSTDVVVIGSTATTTANYYIDPNILFAFFKYASSTAFTATSLFATNQTVTNATTTSLAVTSLPSTLLKTNANGSVIPAIANTDYVPGRATFDYGTSNFSTTTVATTSSIWTQGVFLASSTAQASQFPFASTTAISISNLTATRIPFSSTGGMLTDDSLLSFTSSGANRDLYVGDSSFTNPLFQVDSRASQGFSEIFMQGASDGGDLTINTGDYAHTGSYLILNDNTWGSTIELGQDTVATGDILVRSASTTKAGILNFSGITGSDKVFFLPNWAGQFAVATGTLEAPSFVATSTTASILPYASTTAITSTNASTTNLVVSSAGGTPGCATFSGIGVLSNTGTACGTGGGGSGTYPFTPSTVGGVSVSATSTALQDTAGFFDNSWRVASSSVVVCAYHCQYSDIQTALDAGYSNIALKQETYTLSAPLQIKRNSISIRGNGRGTVINWDAATAPVAFGSNDYSSSRSFTVLQDVFFNQTGTAGTGTCMDVSTFLYLRVSNVSCAGSLNGIMASTTNSFYDNFSNTIMNTSGASSTDYFFMNNANDNVLSNTRAITSSATIGYYFSNVHAITCIKCNTETNALIGMQLGPSTNDMNLDVYLEGNQQNLVIANADEQINITGFIADASDINNGNIVDNGCSGCFISARVQYDAKNELLGNQFTIGTTTQNTSRLLTIQGTDSTFMVYQASSTSNLTNTAPMFTSPTSSVSLFIGSGATGKSSFSSEGSDVSSGDIRFNGASAAWGDFGYYPNGTTVSTTSYGTFRLSTNGTSINTTPNAKLGVGSFYAGGTVGFATTSPFGKFAIQLMNGSVPAGQNAFLIASSTANSTTTLFAIDNTGSTTASNGMNITSGCFSINGTCLPVAAANVSSVTNGDGTLSVAPTTGNVVVGLNNGHANNWLALQTFTNASSTYLGGQRAFFGLTATSTFSSAGVLSLANIKGVAGNCLHADINGVISGVGADCGSSAVNTVSNSDGSLTISPTTGDVVSSLNPGHANNWTGLQTFTNATSTLLTAPTAWLTTIIDSGGHKVLFPGFTGYFAVATGTLEAPSFVATSTTASILPYASSTALSATGSLFVGNTGANDQLLFLPGYIEDANLVNGITVQNLITLNGANYATGVTMGTGNTRSGETPDGNAWSFTARDGIGASYASRLVVNNGYQLNTADSAGIGIGTSTPWWPLQIANSQANFVPQLTLTDSSLNHWSLWNKAGVLFIATSSRTVLPQVGGAGTSTVSALTIDTNGIVSINALNVSSALLTNVTLTNASSSSLFSKVLKANGASFGQTGTSTFTSAGFLGISTSSPGSALSVQGNQFIAGNIISTSSLASVFPYASTTALTAAGTVYASNFFDTSAAGSSCIGDAGGILENGNCVASIASAGGSLTVSSPTGNVDLSFNLAHANSWTGLQSFTNASSTFFSVFNTAYFGGTATSTFDSTGGLTVNGRMTVASTSNIYFHWVKPTLWQPPASTIATVSYEWECQAFELPVQKEVVGVDYVIGTLATGGLGTSTAAAIFTPTTDDAFTGSTLNVSATATINATSTSNADMFIPLATTTIAAGQHYVCIQWSSNQASYYRPANNNGGSLAMTPPGLQFDGRYSTTTFGTFFSNAPAWTTISANGQPSLMIKFIEHKM